jgi:hypothetical protein
MLDSTIADIYSLMEKKNRHPKKVDEIIYNETLKKV